MRQHQTPVTPMTGQAPAAASTVLIWVALGIVYLVWGSTYLAIRVVVHDMPAMASASWRYLTAAVVLAGLLSLRSGLGRLRARPAELAGCAVLGLLLPALGNGVVSIGEQMGAPSGVAALLVAAVPLWIIVYRAVSGDRPSARTTFGVLLGFAGLIALIVAGGAGGEIKVLPCLVIIGATVCWSLGSWSMPRLTLPRDPFVVTVYEMLFGGVFLVAGALIRGEDVVPQAASLHSWLAWGYLVVFGSVVAFTAYVWVLDAAPISLVATYAYVNPIVAVFLGWLILAEPVSWPILVGGVVVVFAVALVVAAERHARKVSPGTETPPGAPPEAQRSTTPRQPAKT
ncbi:MAG: EamA family transporter [Nocardioidaceae bacterium]